MANLMLRHLAKLSKIEQMWHLPMVCSKFSIRVNPFFRPVYEAIIAILLKCLATNGLLTAVAAHFHVPSPF